MKLARITGRSRTSGTRYHRHYRAWFPRPDRVAAAQCPRASRIRHLRRLARAVARALAGGACIRPRTLNHAAAPAAAGLARMAGDVTCAAPASLASCFLHFSGGALGEGPSRASPARGAFAPNWVDSFRFAGWTAALAGWSSLSSSVRVLIARPPTARRALLASVTPSPVVRWAVFAAARAPSTPLRPTETLVRPRDVGLVLTGAIAALIYAISSVTSQSR